MKLQISGDGGQLACMLIWLAVNPVEGKTMLILIRNISFKVTVRKPLGIDIDEAVTDPFVVVIPDDVLMVQVCEKIDLSINPGSKVLLCLVPVGSETNLLTSQQLLCSASENFMYLQEEVGTLRTGAFASDFFLTA